MKKGFYIVFLILFSIVLFVSSRTVKADLTPQEYNNDPLSKSYTHKEFQEKVPWNKESCKLEDQSQEWRDKMSELGHKLDLAKIGLIYFVHGTFAGDDPFGIIHIIKCGLSPKLESKLPKIEKKLNDYFEKNEKKYRNYFKETTDKMLGDNGNYPDEYVKLFEKAIGDNIPCDQFTWSSRNHHLARLRDSMKLAETLVKDINEKMPSQRERILLIGHSHAGQLFALLTNFLAQSPRTNELLDIAAADGENITEFNEALQVIRKVHLDIVTFGTPPRYGWREEGCRLLNIINHRGKGYSGGSINGFFWTRDGDYIQQWGIAGTDIPALTNNERELNRQLDSILGEGANVGVWLKDIQAKMRVPHYGKTILVDYKDSSWFLPNCIKTLFGHGVYTKFDRMLFNTQLIVDEWYQ